MLDDRTAVPADRFLSVRKLIPDYQRDFVWSQKELRVFLDDIYGAFQTSPPVNYFIGSMVFEEKDKPNAIYDIVDGQQRVTSIFLILCLGIFELKKRSHQTKKIPHLEAKYIRDGDDFLPLLRGENYITEIFENICISGSSKSEPKAKNISVRAIWLAADEIDEYFKNNFEKTTAGSEALYNFLSFVIKNITFTYYTSTSQVESLIVYERLNSSGKALSELEVAKGLLFRKVENDDTQWDLLKDKWDGFLKQVNHSQLKTDKIFLRHFISIYYKDNLSGLKHSNGLIATASILSFIKKTNSPIVDKPIETIDNLVDYSIKLTNIINGKDIFGNDSSVIKNIIEISNSKAHNLLLIQAKDIEVSRAVELISQAQVFINKILGKFTGNTEQRFARWSNLVFQGYKHNKKPDIIANEVATDAINEFKKDWVEIKQKFDELHYERSRNNCDIILKLAEIYIDHLNKNNSLKEGLKSSQFKTNVDIDHIEPQNSSNFESFGNHLLGNLALLSKSPNASIKDTPLPDKKKISAYEDSNFYSTKYIIPTSTTHGGAEGEARKLFSRVEVSGRWSLNETENRKQILLNLLENYILKELTNISS